METTVLLAFLFLPGVGNRSALRLLRGFPPAAALSARGYAAYRDPGARRAAWDRALREHAAAAGAGARLLALPDPAYPALLAALPDPPALLWVRGALPTGPALAVVGTRTPTPFGTGAAADLAAAAAHRGWTVVSGLARGVDAAAHRGALAGGGPSVAVLAGGVDTVYPPEHAGLAAALLRSGGALVSEQPLGTAPTPGALVRRNRTLAGLARAVAVCETGPAGGAMHAARAALATGRPLACPMPPEGPEPAWAGLRLLLDDPRTLAFPAGRPDELLARLDGGQGGPVSPWPGDGHGQF